MMKLGPLTDTEAKALLPATILKAGGGWFPVDGREWYACVGAHKCGHNGWKVMEPLRGRVVRPLTPTDSYAPR